jgi:hypothetical protein
MATRNLRWLGRIAASSAVVSFVIGAGAMSTARAATYNLDLIDGGPISPDDGADGLQISFAARSTSTDFVDFTVAGGASVYEITVGGGSANITYLSFVLDKTASLGGAVTGVLGVPSLSAGIPTAVTSSETYTGVTAGTYQLAVTGTEGAGKGIAPVTISVSPVPLPGGLALFGTGMLFLAGIGWRYGRKNAT